MVMKNVFRGVPAVLAVIMSLAGLLVGIGTVVVHPHFNVIPGITYTSFFSPSS